MESAKKGKNHSLRPCLTGSLILIRFLDEEDHSPCQIREHPENVHLRKVEMSDIRTRKMKLRMARDLSMKKGPGQRTVSSQMPAVSRKQKGAGMAAASKRKRLPERGQAPRGIEAALSDR